MHQLLPTDSRSLGLSGGRPYGGEASFPARRAPARPCSRPRGWQGRIAAVRGQERRAEALLRPGLAAHVERSVGYDLRLVSLPGPPPPSLPPLPPSSLISRVVSALPSDDSAHLERFSPHHSGWEYVRIVQREVAVLGKALSDFERILEFGCGPGLVMRHLGYLANACQLDGVDIDSDMVAWCAEHIPFASFLVASPEPPLPYAPASFDLILDHSESARFPERHRELWLAELQRLLAPEGVVLSVDHAWIAALAATPSPKDDDPPPSWKGYTQHRSMPV
jgi:Methyltransferase domain